MILTVLQGCRCWLGSGTNLGCAQLPQQPPSGLDVILEDLPSPRSKREAGAAQARPRTTRVILAGYAKRWR